MEEVKNDELCLEALAKTLILQMDQIACVDSEEDLIGRVMQQIEHCQNALNELQEFVIGNTLDAGAKKLFFNSLMPEFQSRYRASKEILEILLSQPVQSREARIVHLREAIQKWQRLEAMQKINLSGSNLRATTEILTSKLTTVKIIQYVREILLPRITGDKHPTTTIRWTGPKTALIEMIYSLYAAGVLEKGRVELKSIATTFEQIFNIDLGNYYRTFQDIRMRKKEKTIFLDELKTALMNRMDEMDS